MENNRLYPAVTVCLPVYNTSLYLKECMDSILNQTFTNFELLIVDDGSTDNSVEIIKSYTDSRIRLIEKKHNYMETCNLLLDEAKGKYVARMDADDIMMPYRLQVQYDYLEANPQIDILGGSIRFFGAEERDNILYHEGDITLESMLDGCRVAHSTTMMVRARINEFHIRYAQEFVYAEDYHFWVQALISGLRIKNLKQILTKYRRSDHQVSSIYNQEQHRKAKMVQKKISRWLSRSEEEWAMKEQIIVPESVNKLTVIIPFLNEKEEVLRTVQSIRESVGALVDILVINDQSNDGYNYRDELRSYNVTYLYNIERKGVAASRDYGVSLCKTPYFLLLDAHMRFYNKNWAEEIVFLLEKDDRCLLCCQTRFLQKDENGLVTVSTECPKTYGAYSPFDKKNYLPDITWNYIESEPESCIEPIPAVLGAGYAASKRYWIYLRGLEGLLCYGSDEAYISFKVWMEGGRCLLLKEIEIGHIYRSSSPYHRHNEEEVYNSLMISYVLFPRSWYCLSFAIALYNNRWIYQVARQLLEENFSKIEPLKSYYQQKLTHSFQSIVDIHRTKMNVNKKYVEKILDRLAEVSTYLVTYQPVTFGLYEGKAGLMIWFCHYARYTKDQRWDDEATTLWNEIQKTVYDNILPWNFRYGICGIGWAILYLYFNGFLEDRPDEMLHYIDKTIQTFDPTLCENYDLNTGLGGLFAYVSLRLKIEVSPAWDERFKMRLNKAAIELLQHKTSVPAYYYAMQYLEIQNRGVEKEDSLPSFRDWIEFPTYLSEEQRYWNSSLTSGCSGVTLWAMLVQNQINKL